MSALAPYEYKWPDGPFDPAQWRQDDGFLVRDLPETDRQLAVDSRWPGFFPAPMCIVTTSDGEVAALEKVVGPSIANRFPYIAALSLCRVDLSPRHYARTRFMQVLERGGRVAIQFLPPGPALDRVMQVITRGEERDTLARLDATGLPMRRSASGAAPVFADAYLVYQGALASPSLDIEGSPIFARPWRDVGSHRVYFIEVEAIALQDSIVAGDRQIFWRSLPRWQPERADGFAEMAKADSRRFIKGYNPHYRFPSSQTVEFAAERFEGGMGWIFPRRQPVAQLRQLGNDDARWPCFFPSSVGLITTWAAPAVPTLIPCGSTTIVSRQPLVVAACVSYASINERYAPRASLELIRKAAVFGCGVPYLDPRIVDALTYSGNVSFDQDPSKILHSGLTVQAGHIAPLLPALPVSFECTLIGEERLGTHAMLLGQVRRVWVRRDVGVGNPLRWFPWSDVVAAGAS